MIFNYSNFNVIITAWTLLSLLVFVILNFVKAPYGKHDQEGWGIRIPARLGWIAMEMPSWILMTIFALISLKNGLRTVSLIMACFWILHYFHRSMIWPFRAKISHKKMPLSIAFLAGGFNIINTSINAEWIFFLRDPYPLSWLYSIQFVGGMIIFFTGFIINISSDNILFKLRKDGKGEYSIPNGKLFNYISCPNYLGEILEWLGWAIMVLSFAGFSFFVWTLANLIPRALSTHKWYNQKFQDYPKDRKALLPYLL